METAKNEKTNESTLSGQETPENSASPVENPDTDSELSSASASNTDPLDVDESEPSSKIPWCKRKKLVYGCIAGACCEAIAGGGIVFALSQQGVNTENNQPKTTTTQKVVEKQEETGIKVSVDLPDWDEDSTPALLEINDGVKSTYQAIESKDAKDVKVSLAKGDYSVKLISPINSDGSIYIVSDEVKTTIDDANKEVNFPINGSKLPAEDVTDDQIKEIQKKFDDAKEQGKVDQGVVDKVNKNADAGKDARESKSDEEKKEAQETVKEEVKNTSNGTSSSSSSTSSQSSSSASTSSSSDSSSAPAHTHNWVAHYTTIHHDAVTHEEPIYQLTERSICSACGADITGNVYEHVKAEMLAGNPGGDPIAKLIIRLSIIKH